jgi:hypothetical protein
MLCMGLRFSLQLQVSSGWPLMTTEAERRRALAHSRLMATILQLREDGEAVPCVKRDRAYLWVSEDPAEQEAASLGCVDCPALEACGSYVAEWPERSGVWAGRVGKREVIR